MRKNMYERRIEQLERLLVGIKTDAEKAAKIWAHVEGLSREQLCVLEDLLRDELHGEDE